MVRIGSFLRSRSEMADFRARGRLVVNVASFENGSEVVRNSDRDCCVVKVARFGSFLRSRNEMADFRACRRRRLVVNVPPSESGALNVASFGSGAGVVISMSIAVELSSIGSQLDQNGQQKNS